MSFWLTNTGSRFLLSLGNLYRSDPKARVLLFIGAYPENILESRLKRMNIAVTACCRELDALPSCPPEAGQGCCIVLKSLCSVNPDSPMKRLRQYCARHQLQLFQAPVEMTQLDFAQELDEAQGQICQKNPDPTLKWVLQIAHESAVILTGGSYDSYFRLRQQMLASYMRSPDTLPDVGQIADEISRTETPALRYARQIVSRPLMDIGEENWLVLWSLGLAGKSNGVWQYSYQLLNRPQLQRTLFSRLQQAYMATLTPVYMAWVQHCTGKYNLREMDDFRQPLLWYPKEIHLTLTEIPAAARKDADGLSDALISEYVRALRNWVQHGNSMENPYQNAISAMKGCMLVMRRITPNGLARTN